MGKLVIASGPTLVTERLPCVRATFHGPDEDPFLAIAATDERGTVYGVDYGSVRPGLVEIVRSEAHAIRGNHVHRTCAETFTVLSGDVSVFLLCGCPGRHLLEERMVAGSTVSIAPGTPHALFARTRSESVSAYAGGDPRHDRDRVTLVEY